MDLGRHVTSTPASSATFSRFWAGIPPTSSTNLEVVGSYPCQFAWGERSVPRGWGVAHVEHVDPMAVLYNAMRQPTAHRSETNEPDSHCILGGSRATAVSRDLAP